MPLTKGKKRLSVDLDEDVYKDLESFMDKLRWTNPPALTKGSIINYATKNLVSVDDDVLEELYAFCVSKSRLHAKKALSLDDTSFDGNKETRISDQYSSLAHMYSHFAAVAPSYEPDIKDMKRIDVKGGYVIFPKNWIVLNWGRPDNSENVFVIETVDLYGKFNMPHFLLFDESMQTVEACKKKIFEEASKAYPKFNDVLDKEVEPMYGEEDENGNRILLNADAYNKAPKVLIFQIPEAGNERRQNYPYNAKVYRSEER